MAICDFYFLLKSYRCSVKVQTGPVGKFPSLTCTVSRAYMMYKQCAFYFMNDSMRSLIIGSIHFGLKVQSH